MHVWTAPEGTTVLRHSHALYPRRCFRRVMPCPVPGESGPGGGGPGAGGARRSEHRGQARGGGAAAAGRGMQEAGERRGGRARGRGRGRGRGRPLSPAGAAARVAAGAGGGAVRSAAAAAAPPPAQPEPAAAAGTGVMAAVLSPRVCDSDPATPGAQSLKVSAARGARAGEPRAPAAAAQAGPSPAAQALPHGPGPGGCLRCPWVPGSYLRSSSIARFLAAPGELVVCGRPFARDDDGNNNNNCHFGLPPPPLSFHVLGGRPVCPCLCPALFVSQTQGFGTGVQGKTCGCRGPLHPATCHPYAASFTSGCLLPPPLALHLAACCPPAPSFMSGCAPLASSAARRPPLRLASLWQGAPKNCWLALSMVVQAWL